MVLVGAPLEASKKDPSKEYLQRPCLDHDGLAWFEKKEIINADNQRKSLERLDVEVDYTFLGNRKSPKKLVQSGWKLFRLTKDEKIDLVHAMWGATTGLICVLFSNVPVIISFCGSDLLGNYASNGKSTLSGKLSSLLSKLSALFAGGIIVKSSHLKQSLWPWTRKKAKIIPNGIDLQRFYPMEQKKAQEELGWNPQRKHILFFKGGGAFVKNEPLARRIYQEISEKEPHTDLHIIEGVAHEKLVYYYNAADLLLLTSFHEGSNNSLKEAIACNLPVVSSNVGDAFERLMPLSQCRVIDSFKKEGFVQAALEILQTGKRTNGRDFSNEISEEVIADSIVDFYRKLIQEK